MVEIFKCATKRTECKIIKNLFVASPPLLGSTYHSFGLNNLNGTLHPQQIL